MDDGCRSTNLTRPLGEAGMAHLGASSNLHQPALTLAAQSDCPPAAADPIYSKRPIDFPRFHRRLLPQPKYQRVTMNNETPVTPGTSVAGKTVGESLRNLDMDPEVIEHVLLHTTLSRLVKGAVKYGKARPKPATKFSFFAGYHGVNTQQWPMDVKPTDLSRPFDHALVLPL